MRAGAARWPAAAGCHRVALSDAGAGMAASIDVRPAVAGVPAGLGAPRRRFNRRRLRETWIAYLFLLPALTIIGIFHFFPVFYAFWISLRKWNLVDSGM